MLPKVVARCIRFHETAAIGAFRGSDTGVAADEGRKGPCRRAVARDRVYGQTRTAKSPGAPHIIGVDRYAIGNSCLIVVMPERIAQRV